ncbi:MAG: hypothetical protein K0R15_188 [Clostridiales bacterium]|jgi:spore coat protein CotH|nr:hypothetical protein [Clostridiales bacterium]
MRKLVLSLVFLVTVGILAYITVLSKSYQPNLLEVYSTNVKCTSEFEHLFDHNNFREFKIVISQEEWDGMSQDMEDYFRIDQSMRVGTYRKADIYYTDNYGESVIKDVGIHTKGNTTRVVPETNGKINRFNFKLKFDETFSEIEGTDTYINLNNREFADLSELNFKFNNGSDQSLIHEIFAYDLFNSAGVNTVKASLATVIVVIDGKEYDYGVYTIIEPIDKKFLKKRYGKDRDEGNLYKCLWQNYGPASLERIRDKSAVGIKNWKYNYRPAYDLKTNKNKADHQVLYDFIDNINLLEGDLFKDYIEENFDVDMFLRYLAMGILVGGPDDYRAMGNNYYLYFNNDGKIALLPYDYDNSFGAGWGGEPATNYVGLLNADIYKYISIDSVLSKGKVRKPLVDKILEIDAYREKYEDYLEILVDSSNNYFTYSKFEETFNRLNRVYGEHTSNYFNTSLKMKLSTENQYFKKKIASVTSQLEEANSNE